MTPKFFVPEPASPAQAERVYQSVRSFMEQVAFAPTERRIFSLRYRHRGQTHDAVIGGQDVWSKETIVAILEANGPRGDKVYMICTPSHGVAKSGPLIASDVSDIVDFKA